MRATMLLLAASSLGLGCGSEQAPTGVRPDPMPVTATAEPTAPRTATPTASASTASVSAASSCAVKSSTLGRPQEHQCLEGVAPHLGDLKLSLEPASPTTPPGGVARLTLRMVNVSDHTLSVRTTLPLGEELVVKNDKGVKIAPPEGSAVTLPSAECAGMTCSHAEVERGVVVALLPGGVIEDFVEWQSSRMAWPPAQKQRCCGPNHVSPIAKAALAAGTYQVSVSPRLWSEPAWIEPSASVDIAVH